MKKYIEAEQLKAFMYTGLTGNDLYKPNGIDEFVDWLPAADVQEVVKEWCWERNFVIVASEDFPRLEVRHGQWIEVSDDGRAFKCSVCGEISCCNAPYCNECGAKMDEVTE